jgi:CRP-like cAMP-binding protein
MMSTTAPTRNALLGALPSAELAVVQPHLRAVEFRKRDMLISADDPVPVVYFPVAGLISEVSTLDNGNAIEAAAIGREGVVGVVPALGSGYSLADYIVQVPGSGYSMPVERFRAAVEELPALRSVLNRHAEAVSALMLQSLACVAFHPVEARLARWLLIARDSIGSDVLPLTQEFLAQMLGVQRTTVTLAAQSLEGAGLIRYRRGNIDVQDVAALRQSACSCYEQVRQRRSRAFPEPRTPAVGHAGHPATL